MSFLGKIANVLQKPFEKIEREAKEKEEELKAIVIAAKVAAVAAVALGTLLLLSTLASGSILVALAGIGIGGHCIYDGIKVFKNAIKISDLNNVPGSRIAQLMIDNKTRDRLIIEGLLCGTLLQSEIRFISRQVEKIRS